MNVDQFQQSKYPPQYASQTPQMHQPVPLPGTVQNTLNGLPSGLTQPSPANVNQLSQQVNQMSIQGSSQFQNPQFPPPTVQNAYESGQPNIPATQNYPINPSMPQNNSRPTETVNQYAPFNEPRRPPQSSYPPTDGTNSQWFNNQAHAQQTMIPQNNYVNPTKQTAPPGTIPSGGTNFMPPQINSSPSRTVAPPPQSMNTVGLHPPASSQNYHANTVSSNNSYNGAGYSGMATNQMAGGPCSPPGFPPSGLTSGPYGGGGSNMQHHNPYLSHEMQQTQRLDPDQMPNPLQVWFDDEANFGGKVFQTNQIGISPPLVSTNFIVEDAGNTSPKFIRSTMNSIPRSPEMMKRADIPFGLVITPLATLHPDEEVPMVVDTGECGPTRCVRCKAYMNPFAKFIDGGRRFVCVLCLGTTDVPPEYFQHLDHTGSRVDRFDRPELCRGTYEFTVTKEYCKNNEIPNVPAIIFLIDVSYNNVKSGMVSLLCEHIHDIILNNMPVQDNGYSAASNSRMRVGFITYDSKVHFYNIKSCLGQPQMMIVSDIDDMFVPLVDGFLCDPVDSSTLIQSLAQLIPKTFAETKETDTIMLPAVKAGLEALKAAKCAGKLIVFHSTLPNINAPGKLSNRDDRKLLGTEKEKTVLTPQGTAYTSLAEECVDVGCSVDLFVFNNSFIDLPTLGELSRITGGEIFKYTYFQHDIDGERLLDDLKKNLGREIYFDAIMRVRTSTGTRPMSFYGNLFMRNATEVELASINSDKSIAVEIILESKIEDDDIIYVQVATLFTSCFGERRVRIFNLAFRCCDQLSELYKSCELDALINYWAKCGVHKLLEGTPKEVKDSIINRSAKILACYRKDCSNPSSPGQLILPESMKLLPLYLNCLLKSDAFSGGSDMTIDDRYFMMQAVSIMDVPSSLNYFYPRLLPILKLNPEEIPLTIRCSSYRMSKQEAYILENGIYMFLWIGSQVPAEWNFNVFGVHDLASANLNKLQVLDNEYSRKLDALIEQLQSERRRAMRITIVREADKMEIVFKRFLAEDGSSTPYSGNNITNASYVDFLCHMHKMIRDSLN